MKYYLGGYYLMKLKPKRIESDNEETIYTCSTCINDNLVDGWSYTWTTDNNEQAIQAKKDLNLSDTQITAIRNWVDNKHNENKLGWINVFIDLETAIVYKATFFSHLNDVKIMALYFDETERRDILKAFEPQSEQMGEIGLRLALLKEIEENEEEQFLGYDYIGIEAGGCFHTFHCHDIGKELTHKFNLRLNDFVLFESDKNAKQVLDYLNDENNGCEAVPWFIAKTKLVMDGKARNIKL